MWRRVAEACLGLCLTASPSLLGYGGPARVNALVAGPLAVSAAIVALSEVTRPVRWCNVAIGCWLVVSPLVIAHTAAAAITHVLTGVLLAAAASRPGRVSGRYGGGWSVLWSNPDSAV
jgi:hypothetical protein